jgi:hypothetical protein
MSAVKGRTRAGCRFRAARPPSRWRSAMVAASMVTSTMDCRTSGRTANRVNEPGSLCPGITHGGDLRSVRYRHTGTVHFCVADMASAGGLRSERRRIGVLHSSLEGFLFVDRLFVPASCGAAASTSIHWLPSPEATPKKSSGLFTNAHWHTQAKTIDHCREPYAQPRGQQPDLIIRISQVRFRTARHGNRDVLVTVRGLEQTAHLAR